LHSFFVSDAAAIEERLSAIEAEFAVRIAKLERERDEYKKLVVILQEQVERLKRGLLGQKAERLPANDAQLSLALLSLAMGGSSAPAVAEAAPEPEQPDETVVGEHTRKKRARNAHPSEWPRVPINILPPEVEREGLDAFELIGEEKREVLERRSASNVVVELIYKKFVRKDRERNAPTEVLASPAIELPIDRGIAGPGMLADTIVRRWQDHQPLTRLEDIYRREGLGLVRVSPIVDSRFSASWTPISGIVIGAKRRRSASAVSWWVQSRFVGVSVPSARPCKRYSRGDPK
jgi:transposase